MTDPLLTITGFLFFLVMIVVWFLIMWLLSSVLQENLRRKIRTFISGLFIIFVVSSIAFFYGISLQVQLLFWIACIIIFLVLIFLR